jgi:hypothetical protein
VDVYTTALLPAKISKEATMALVIIINHFLPVKLRTIFGVFGELFP